MKIISLTIKILILLILFYITINNLTNVDFYWSINHKINLPLILLLFIFFIIGAIFGFLSILSKLLYLRINIFSLKKKLNNPNIQKN